MGDDEDKIRDLTQKSSVQMIFYHQRNGLRKFFTKRLLSDPLMVAHSHAPSTAPL